MSFIVEMRQTKNVLAGINAAFRVNEHYKKQCSAYSIAALAECMAQMKLVAERRPSSVRLDFEIFCDNAQANKLLIYR